ncbi:MAG: hypothetical protein JWP81_3471 [Ferruginibacter sp.]|nr:hypothetical protein [Ferruginibacter sp.]
MIVINECDHNLARCIAKKTDLLKIIAEDGSEWRVKKKLEEATVIQRT